MCSLFPWLDRILHFTIARFCVRDYIFNFSHLGIHHDTKTVNNMDKLWVVNNLTTVSCGVWYSVVFFLCALESCEILLGWFLRTASRHATACWNILWSGIVYVRIDAEIVSYVRQNLVKSCWVGFCEQQVVTQRHGGTSFGQVLCMFVSVPKLYTGGK
jgi:hypothetical protein